MRVMGLDVGDKYIGLAVSDAIGLTAHGLTTVERDSRCIGKLIEIIEEYEVTSIVVGIPKMLNGSIGVQGEKVLKFIEELKGAIDLPIFQWDERLSTVAAERVLLEADLSRKKRKGLRDKVAAIIILQSYLDSRPAALREARQGGS
ncbi:MAG: Holliday junction resolvase RuvX [Nitrospirae bacterium]|nr:Holliday junction resolvase RuvX [Nitrospirota bacterium]